MPVHEEELVELLETETDEGQQKSRRRRRRRRKRAVVKNSLMSASDILSRAAKDDGVESSPSSLGAALELEGEEACTTGTPGSMDSSRSLWELGTVEAEEDEILSVSSGSKAGGRPVITSRRMQSLEVEQDVDRLTMGIDEILRSLPSSSELKNRLCVPSSKSNRLCIDNVPRMDLTGISNIFEIIKTTVSESLEAVAGKLIETKLAQPEGLDFVLQSIDKADSSAEGIIPSSSVPALNRRQRRILSKD